MFLVSCFLIYVLLLTIWYSQFLLITIGRVVHNDSLLKAVAHGGFRPLVELRCALRVIEMEMKRTMFHAMICCGRCSFHFVIEHSKQLFGCPNAQ
jgi:hypothetical protein